MAAVAMSVLIHCKGGTAFFRIRSLLLDLVIVVQSVLLCCGIFRFGSRKSGAGQNGCQNTCCQ